MLQVALWSALVLAGVSAVGAVAFWLRGRHADEQPMPDRFTEEIAPHGTQR